VHLDNVVMVSGR